MYQYSVRDLRKNFSGSKISGKRLKDFLNESFDKWAKSKCIPYLREERNSPITEVYGVDNLLIRATTTEDEEGNINLEKISFEGPHAQKVMEEFSNYVVGRVKRFR